MDDRLRSLRSDKWSRYPPDVLPAWVAEMDFELAPPVRDALIRAVELGDLGYVGNVDGLLDGVRGLHAAPARGDGRAGHAGRRRHGRHPGGRAPRDVAGRGRGHLAALLPAVLPGDPARRASHGPGAAAGGLLARLRRARQGLRGRRARAVAVQPAQPDRAGRAARGAGAAGVAGGRVGRARDRRRDPRAADLPRRRVRVAGWTCPSTARSSRVPRRRSTSPR